MNSQKKITKPSVNSTNTTNNFIRKPRRSIKAEGNCLNGMLREGSAHVIDASKLGKRLSSEIWNSFGAIQVQDDFVNPSIDTKVVADNSSTVRICQFFVACSKCFSVFKYDGHAYGTTGLVKHVKICQGTNKGINAHNSTTTNSGYLACKLEYEHNIDTTHTSSSSVLPNNNNTTLATLTPSHTTNATATNGPLSTPRRRREPNTPRSRAVSQPSIRYLAKVVEELRNEQVELRQKIHEMINLMTGSGYVSQIQIISNDGDKVEDELQKND